MKRQWPETRLPMRRPTRSTRIAMRNLHASQVRDLNRLSFRFLFSAFSFLFQITSANVRSILRKYQMPLAHSPVVKTMDISKPGQ